jgi:hypothetical protein
LCNNFWEVLKDQTAGDPMQADIKWTNLSRRTIARLVSQRGTAVTRGTVGVWLKANGFRRRQTQKKKTMGSHAQRDAQFKRISKLKRKYLKAGDAVISIDSKKKELLGEFQRPGKLECQAMILVNDHDFSSEGEGKLIPHGIYDLTHNRGYIHLNTSHDTTQLSCDSVELWWLEHGRVMYPNCKKLLILCDGGGSNSSRYYRRYWK